MCIGGVGPLIYVSPFWRRASLTETSTDTLIVYNLHFQILHFTVKKADASYGTRAEMKKETCTPR